MENFLKDMKQIIIKGELSTYYISKDAKIYNTKTSRWIKGRMAPNGYWDFILNHGGKQHSFRAHRLVAEYFIPNPENKKQVNHIDGNKLNNNLNNLEWITNEDNMKHAVKNNLIAHQIGESNPCNKLSEQTVLEIIDHLLNKDMSVSDMAEIYNCSKSTIYAIKGKRNWRYLTKDINF